MIGFKFMKGQTIVLNYHAVNFVQMELTAEFVVSKGSGNLTGQLY